MGGKGYTAKHKNIVTPRQSMRMGGGSEIPNITRIVLGGFERITYKEEVNGVTIIRTRWRRKKKKERKKRS